MYGKQHFVFNGSRINVHGFAARCEAVALPRRLARAKIGLRPWFGLCPRRKDVGVTQMGWRQCGDLLRISVDNGRVITSHEGPEPEPEAEPKRFWHLTGGHSHRLTSGGEAVPLREKSLRAGIKWKTLPVLLWSEGKIGD